MKPVVKNAADEGQVKDAEKKAKSQREQELEDVRSLLATQHGRRFIWRYLSACGVFTSSWNHSGSIMCFNEGQRNIGLKLLSDVNEASPDAYLVMMKEAKEGEK